MCIFHSLSAHLTQLAKWCCHKRVLHTSMLSSTPQFDAWAVAVAVLLLSVTSVGSRCASAALLALLPEVILSMSRLTASRLSATMTVSGQQFAEAGMPTVPVFDVAPLAGVVTVGSSACACLTDSRLRLRTINGNSSKRSSFNNIGQ